MDSSHRPRMVGGNRPMNRTRGPMPKADRGLYDGKSKRPMIVRKAVDFQSDAITYITNRAFKASAREYPAIQPSEAFVKSMLPPTALGEQPTSSITGRYIHKAHNKIPHPTFSLAWTLDGRRLFTGNSAGEITMWDGKTFNFTSLVSTGRNEAVRALTWSHSGDFLLTGDGGGYVGYYEPTLKPLYAMQSHRKAIRGLSFAPTDTKFVSCSDDSTCAIWDFATRKSESVLEGHNWDVRAVDWHPYNSLIVSGAKDKLIKLWDAKSKSNIHTWQGHKGDVTKVCWNQNGNWFLSSSRDYSMRIFDIRMMKELQVIRGNGEICSIAWHPYHEKLFVSGDGNGDISFWLAGQEVLQGRLYGAHYSAIWDLKWHPFGHILCASGNDCYTSFWCRNRPGDKMEDRYNDPAYIAQPSKMDLEAQAAATAAAAAAALSTGASSDPSDPSDPHSTPQQAVVLQPNLSLLNEEISSSQKQLIVPGAVGFAAQVDYASIFGNDNDTSKMATDPRSSHDHLQPGHEFFPFPSVNPSSSAGSSSLSSQKSTKKDVAASLSHIPGLGQVSSGSASLRGFGNSSFSSSTSTASQRGRRDDKSSSGYGSQSGGSYHHQREREGGLWDGDRREERRGGDDRRDSSGPSSHYGNPPSSSSYSSGGAPPGGFGGPSGGFGGSFVTPFPSSAPYSTPSSSFNGPPPSFRPPPGMNYQQPPPGAWPPQGGAGSYPPGPGYPPTSLPPPNMQRQSPQPSYPPYGYPPNR